MSKESDEEKLENSLKEMSICERSDYNESVPINRLPIEVFCMILKYFDLADLFQYESVRNGATL